MRNEKYEKPNLKFVSLRNEEKIANTCWGGHNKGTTWYYNTSGVGWVSFQISAGSCTLNLTNVTYYDGDGNNTTIDNSSDYYIELYDALVEAGGQDGNNFSKESEITDSSPKNYS